jgi:predicted alpha/beta hydrolase family esterase
VAIGHPVTEIIMLPGYAGSGEFHWQTYWEAADPEIRRLAPSSWDKPELEDWASALEVAVENAKSPPVFVAHSLGCLLVAHWAAWSSLPVAGAFLVAPPDPESCAFGEPGKSFAIVPEGRLRFPSLIVASSDDLLADLDYVDRRADQWGSAVIDVGPQGHLGSVSNLVEWKQGRDLLTAFMTGLVPR